MRRKIDHSILIVDDEKSVGTSIERLFRKDNIKFVFASNGNEGLSIIKKVSFPFSIIISDERMPGMRGHEFFAKVKIISPDSLRFLITGFSNLDSIINAINRGVIHRYISKPWDSAALIETINTGIEKYKQVFENDQLLKKAQDISDKLYSMNYDLIRNSRQHKKKMDVLDIKIKEIKTKIQVASEEEAMLNPKFGEKAEQLIKDNEWMSSGIIRLLYFETIKELSEQFRAIAERNGIEFLEDI